MLEAADEVGGRIRTDTVGGFRLDRGFQVLLTSYPEAKTILDYDALDLKPFLPCALVCYGGQFHEVTGLWRRPFGAIRSLRSPIGSFTDKLRVASFRSGSLRGTIEDHFRDPETTSLQALQDAGFSPSMIARFFRLFLGGIFLDSDLCAFSCMLSFLVRMFSLGNACLPAEAMEAIPRQPRMGLPPGSIRLRSRVVRVGPGAVTLSTGEELSAKSVVVAVEGRMAAKLLGDTISQAGQGTTCLYFAAPRPPIAQPLLVLNGDGRGPINNLCVPTGAAPSYGPGGKSLVSVTILGTGNDPNRLLAEVCEHLGEWFGTVVQPSPRLSINDLSRPIGCGPSPGACAGSCYCGLCGHP